MSEEPKAEDFETPSALPIAPGQVIASRYRVGPVLGEGGMGIVCAGTHVLLGTAVAIKLIHSELKHDQEAVQRFVNEARATAALKGEHIARVFDVGVLPSGEPYLVMEQLEGIGLDDHLCGRGPLAQSEAIGIALQVCEGLAEAHAAGIVHRDIKPGNLFLARRPDGKSSVKILDFGIAKQRLRADSPALTNPGKSLGSPYYMSPEQMLTPASVDERADVWSIGVLLFELLTKHIPFDGETVPQVCANVLAASPRRPRELRPDLPEELEALVLRCLEKEPERRFSSVNELANALRDLASSDRGKAGSSDDVEPLLVEAKHLAMVAKSAPTFDSFTPLPTSRDSGTNRRSRWRAWPLATTLVAVASLLFGGWLQYRDPTLVRSAVSAARIHLPGDPRLGPSEPETPLQREHEPPLLLQRLLLAHAFAEPRGADVKMPATWRKPVRPRGPQEPTPAGASWERLTEDRYGF